MESNRTRPDSSKWIVAACAYVVIIFALSTLPGTSRRQHNEISSHFMEILQNALHIPLYAGFAWLLFHAVQKAERRLSMTVTGIVILVAMAIALLDEWIQSHVPGRTASLLDVGLDLLGVLSVAIPMRLKLSSR